MEIDKNEEQRWREHLERKVQIAVDEHFYFTGETVNVNITFKLENGIQ